MVIIDGLSLIKQGTFIGLKDQIYEVETSVIPDSVVSVLIKTKINIKHILFIYFAYLHEVGVTRAAVAPLLVLKVHR
ncbi:hypothetical protein DGG96_19265 [Legionella qingyii]|uniref:Uncharacterized protein n=1 Tax=Legionella qingyii TaxID=2184757 RepID=A0A317U0J8_9GAMM|nr:hypothetical protein DGG96_19265 [Legionella qingyii]